MIAESYNKSSNFWTRNQKKIQSDFLCRPYVIKLLGDVKGKSILDIGCGEGYMSRKLAQAGASVTGVDISTKLINSARRQVDHNKKPEYLLKSALNLGRINKKFDAAISVLVYGHLNVSEMNRANLEASKKLKKNGIFILAVPHPFYQIAKPKSRWVKFSIGAANYWQERSNLTLRRVDGEEFKVIKQYSHTFSDYLNNLIEVKFIVDTIVEPRPTATDLRQYSKMWGEESRLPTYLIIKSHLK